MGNPLETIKDGHVFQRIIAEYFRCLKNEEHPFHISDITVEDNGVGADDGCDILVDFHFEDAIKKHTHRWVIECKSQKRTVSPTDIDSNSLDFVLKSNNANGYLLICKSDATAKLKRLFRELKKNQFYDYEIWNGEQLWMKFSQRKSILQAFFPEFYKEKYIDTLDEKNYEEFCKIYQKRFEP